MNWEKCKIKLKSIALNIRDFFKWLAIACVVGIVVGGFSSLFSRSMTWATNFRLSNDFIIYFLPLGGLAIVGLYYLFDFRDDRGTNMVLANIHAESEIPFKMAPLIFISTVLTHLFGGSAGREGAALQLGGSIGNKLGKLLHLDEVDRRVVVMCGMSAAFSALFGTPMAAAIFPIEVVSVGVMYYAALVPCVLASVVASRFASTMGISPEAFQILSIPKITIITGAKVIILSVLCAGISVLFCIVLHKSAGRFRKYIKNDFLRIAIVGAVIVGLSIMLGTRDYMGAGIPVIDRAMEGEAVPFAFVLKILFTALTLGAGYKGGEIVPSFFVGATFGCVIGQLIGLSPSLCAAVGMAAVFCGVTNCPISSILISLELFNYQAAPYLIIAIAVSYMLSGYYGLYKDQKIVYGKHKAKYVNLNAK